MYRRNNKNTYPSDRKWLEIKWLGLLLVPTVGSMVGFAGLMYGAPNIVITRSRSDALIARGLNTNLISEL